jgi:hypothetical protein
MILFIANGDAVARLEGDGARFEVTLALEESGAQCLALGPEPGIIYAGCRGSGIWKSRDGGRSWEDCGLPARDVFSVAVGAVDGAVYAGCEPSSLFVSSDDGDSWRQLEALRRIPSAPTWSFPPRPWTSHVRWVAPSPHDADLLLVGIELGGVMRSEDGGETWEDHRPGAQRDCHALAWHPRVPGRAYEAGGGGAAWSFDAGDTWWAADEGRDRHYVWGLAVDPDDPERWWVSAAPGPFHAHGGRPAQAMLYRWSGHGPWEPMSGLLDSMPYAIVVGPDGLYAGLRDGRILLGSGGGEWRTVELEGAEPERIVAMALAPEPW